MNMQISRNYKKLHKAHAFKRKLKIIGINTLIKPCPTGWRVVLASANQAFNEVA